MSIVNCELLISLLLYHYLADYCLTIPVMIRAKSNGKTLWPIAMHALVHAVLMGICLLTFGIRWGLLLQLMLLEFVSHFIIDTIKARLTAHFPILADAGKKPHWMLYGFDQLLHQLVIIAIWYLATKG